MQDSEISDTWGNISIVRWRGSPSHRTIEILPEGVEDFHVLHFTQDMEIVVILNFMHNIFVPHDI